MHWKSYDSHYWTATSLKDSCFLAKNKKNLNFADQPDAKKVAPQNDCK